MPEEPVTERSRSGNGAAGETPLPDPAQGALAREPDDERDARKRGDEGNGMPRVRFTRKRALLLALFLVAAIAFLYFGLPQIAGLDDTWERLKQGSPWWFMLAALFKVISFAGYTWLFRAVFATPGSPIGWSASYNITMASLAATRLFAAAGAGGVALTAWAVRQSGMAAREVANRSVTMIVLTYVVYVVVLAVDGVLLRSGVLPGPAPFAVTVLPALLGLAAIVVFVAIALIPTDLERRLSEWHGFSHRGARWARRIAAVPAATSSGVRLAARMVADRVPGTLGSLIWWAGDIATLWACFHAFGEPPHLGILVMAYFVGMLGNLLPLPGGIGGVDGGMIGALVAFGVSFDLAVVAVLSYRAFAFWLPTIPGVVAFLALRRTIDGWRRAPAPA